MTRKRVRCKVRGWWPLGWVLALQAASTPAAEGAGIFRGLTASDRAHPILVSATGEAIAPRQPGHPGPGMSGVQAPAYLAFRLGGGEHIPAGTPTLNTGTRAGEGAVGPLGLTPTSQAELNADLRGSRGAIVGAPGGSYAVAMLPRYARALAHESASASSASSGTSVIRSMLGLTPEANWTIQGVPADRITGFLKSGSKTLSHLATTGTGALGKALGLKITPTDNGVNVAAQYLVPPAASMEGAAVPAPEPSAWLTFGVILAAVGVWRGRGGSRGTGESRTGPNGT